MKDLNDRELEIEDVLERRGTLTDLIISNIMNDPKIRKAVVVKVQAAVEKLDTEALATALQASILEEIRAMGDGEVLYEAIKPTVLREARAHVIHAFKKVNADPGAK